VLASSGPRVPRLLALDEEALIAAVAGPRGELGRGFLETFEADEARRDAERRGVGTLCRHDEAYPARLLELADPPAVLYHTGERAELEDLLRAPSVAIVGSRSASGYGLAVAQGLGQGLAASGVTVVSGLALGIDAAAHRGALDAGGRSVAVLACGADVPYPRTNTSLYRRLRERGAIVAELPPGRGVYRWSFPARNRIMAGLSQITVVVEAQEPSGSLITADFAERLGREVGAVPGPVTSRRAAGTNRLLRDGASVIRGPEDVLDALFGAGGAPRTPPPPAEPIGAPERQVLDGVETGEGLDAIGRASGMSAAAVRATLGRLELAGLIARDGLGGYVRKATR
jgi:DNA processing protein